jgi:glycosyltransferase involved in cell wall biosynthesis
MTDIARECGRLRILVANIPLPANRFLQDLNAALSDLAEIVHSSDMFWNMHGDFDVVHLHFPEYLTYEVERAYLGGLTTQLIEAVAERLAFWSERAVIVVTRHVLLPHDALADPAWEKMYETVYSYADGVVHFAQPSVDEFSARYAETVFHRGAPPLHEIVPHHNYASLPNNTDRAEARKSLGIDDSANVLLVFGAIRSDAERELILDTFSALREPHKLLLVSRWREKLASVSWIRLKYWIRDLTRLYYKVRPGFRFNYGFVEESDTQIYLNAADVLLIPRLHVLNSGNITLGMTFGRVVVGPDSWDVGSLLKETGNPVFDPNRPETAASAVERGFALARSGRIGAANRELALTQWTPQQCARSYVDFFCEVVSNRRSLPSLS